MDIKDIQLHWHIHVQKTVENERDRLECVRVQKAARVSINTHVHDAHV